MTRFTDGPADGVVLSLRRSPLFIRAARNRWERDPKKCWDALDQLADGPAPGEELFCYRRVGEASTVHLYFGGGKGGWYSVAEYRYVEPQPDPGTMRDTAKWREWATAAHAKGGVV